jgi:hypothetical protein
VTAGLSRRRQATVDPDMVKVGDVLTVQGRLTEATALVLGASPILGFGR